MYSPIRFIPKVFFKKHPPIQFTFFITNKCNSNCEYCFYDKTKERRLLNLREIDMISKSINGNLLWLLLSGGEPFLHPDIEKICRIFYVNNKPSYITIPTNGFLEEVIIEKVKLILKRCPKSLVTIKISIDGIGDVHDELRGLKGSYERAMRTLRHLITLKNDFENLSVGVNSVYFSKNENDSLALYNKLREMQGLDSVTHSLIRGSIRSDFKDIDRLKYQSFVNFINSDIDKIIRSNKDMIFRQKLAADIMHKEIILDVLKTNKRQIPCYAGKIAIVLTEDGTLYPCELLSSSYGNLRDYNYNIYQILKTNRAHSINKIIKSSCNICDNCTHECNMLTNVLFNPVKLSESFFRII